MNRQKFPKGYKTWRILKEMLDNDGMTHGQIIKYAYEMNYGTGSFNCQRNRGYWSCAFAQYGPGRYPWSFNKYPGTITKNAYKYEDGK